MVCDRQVEDPYLDGRGPMRHRSLPQCSVKEIYYFSSIRSTALFGECEVLRIQIDKVGPGGIIASEPLPGRGVSVSYRNTTTRQWRPMTISTCVHLYAILDSLHNLTA